MVTRIHQQWENKCKHCRHAFVLLRCVGAQKQRAGCTLLTTAAKQRTVGGTPQSARSPAARPPARRVNPNATHQREKNERLQFISSPSLAIASCLPPPAHSIQTSKIWSGQSVTTEVERSRAPCVSGLAVAARHTEDGGHGLGGELGAGGEARHRRDLRAGKRAGGLAAE
jgi:hypothetical protein